MNRAFTLVEVVIAMALLVIALSMFVGTFVQAKKSAIIAENRMEAIHQARSEMEKMFTNKFSNVKSRPATSGIGTNVVTTNDWGGKNIAVTIRWKNPVSALTSTVTLVTSMSEEFHK